MLDDTFNRLDTVHEHCKQADRQTNLRQHYRSCIKIHHSVLKVVTCLSVVALHTF